MYGFYDDKHIGLQGFSKPLKIEEQSNSGISQTLNLPMLNCSTYQKEVKRRLSTKERGSKN